MYALMLSWILAEGRRDRAKNSWHWSGSRPGILDLRQPIPPDHPEALHAGGPGKGCLQRGGVSFTRSVTETVKMPSMKFGIDKLLPLFLYIASL
jgi:hypothetical protein